MNSTLTDKQVEAMDPGEIEIRLNEARKRRDRLLDRQRELSGWLTEAHNHIRRLYEASLPEIKNRSADRDRVDADLGMQKGSRGDVKPPDSEIVYTNWYYCPKCNKVRGPDLNNLCPECGILLAVKSSGDG